MSNMAVSENSAVITLTPEDVIARDRCPVCACDHLADYFDLTFHQISILYQRCRECDLVFMNPVPNQLWYDRLYGQAFWEIKSVKSGLEQVQVRQQQLVKELQRAKKLCAALEAANCTLPPGAQILEIGCAFGLIVSTIAKNYQAVPFGVEPSELAAGFAKAHGGVGVIASTIDQLAETEVQKRMDMILFSHVMENVVDLDKVFSAVTRWLTPNGIVLMETPNSSVKNSTHIYHPYCFSGTSLQRLFDSHGFEIVHLQASGRPSSALIPRYLTLVARPKTGIDNKKGALQTTKMNNWNRLFGHCWRQIVYRTLLAYLDRILINLLYAPNKATKKQARKLAKAHSANNSRAKLFFDGDGNNV